MAQPMGLTASDIEFAEATPEQRRISWELCSRKWAAPMSVDDYVEREQHMAEHELNRDGGCRYWVLYLKGYPRQVIASCETLRKLMFIADCAERRVREAHGYVVTNVYTNPTYRRQGMAAFLLRRVQERMDADSDCSLPDLCQKDIAHLTRTLTSLATATAASNNNNNTSICFLPTYAQISWHLARARFDALKILPSATMATTPLTVGAVTLPSQRGAAWACWSHDWRNKRLRVLRLAREGDSREGSDVAVYETACVVDVAALLEAAVAEARRWGFLEVVVWNPSDLVKMGCKSVGNALPDEVKVVFEQRVEGCVPSLRWKGGKVLAGVVWEENHGYCGC
ncbi:uncharacterized protein P884DRAFT_236406 [Thermothelomyces heterothallicus CBS 202.75]|uniref:uncharacterized protein n=1 Tax=Thermothelomyces heterothallicus CBS 202.75 TaxID=1149848 RepID=UPI003743756E